MKLELAVEPGLVELLVLGPAEDPRTPPKLASTPEFRLDGPPPMAASTDALVVFDNSPYGLPDEPSKSCSNYNTAFVQNTSIANSQVEYYQLQNIKITTNVKTTKMIHV